MLDVSIPVLPARLFVDADRSKRGATSMSLKDEEFRAMRQTIAVRGTVRMVLVPIALSGWALLVGGLFPLRHSPISSAVSLLVLVGTFEAVHALHVGVERIGRFIQVFYEGAADGPRWETTAMQLGPGLPGGGIDPLFVLVFVSATLCNLFVVFLPGPSAATAALLVLIHALFIARVIRARLAAARQRTRDLEMFRRVRGGDSPAAARSTV
jgi:hypothetical protein